MFFSIFTPSCWGLFLNHNNYNRITTVIESQVWSEGVYTAPEALLNWAPREARHTFHVKMLETQPHSPPLICSFIRLSQLQLQFLTSSWTFYIQQLSSQSRKWYFLLLQLIPFCISLLYILPPRTSYNHTQHKSLIENFE